MLFQERWDTLYILKEHGYPIAKETHGGPNIPRLKANPSE